MNKKHKLAIILLLPNLVLLLHAIIPHHHHFDEYLGNDLSRHCKDVHHHQEHEESDCTHCHAFNSTNIQIRRGVIINAASSINLFTLNVYQKRFNFFNSKYVHILTNQYDIHKQSFFTLTLLRAPPL